MWGLRILSGPQSGLVYPLKVGKTLIGRSSHCTIKVDGPNISKEHAYIELDENDKIFITDNKSRNGTIVNGLKIQKVQLSKGNKISLTDILCDIIEVPTPSQKGLVVKSQSNQQISPHFQIQKQNQSHAQQFYPQLNSQTVQPAQNVQQVRLEETPAQKFNNYIDTVLLPGVYKLTEVMEFKLVIALFLFGYAVVLTILATIPMIAISTESIQIEAQRRAITIARSLANINQQALINENETALTTSLAELEEGVSNTYIIRASDGSVMAPATKIGSVPDIPFIEKARKEQKEFVQNIATKQIGVSIPISAYNPDSGGFVIKAYAIVIYDIESLAVEDGRTISLFIQILVLALIIGAILYFLFSRLIEYPIRFLNTQVDLALKNKSETTEPIKIEFPIFQNLITNINTILSRVASLGENDINNNNLVINKEIEASNMINLIGYASIGFSKELNIISLNHAFENLMGVSESNLRNQPISLIPDQALQKNIHDLLDRASKDPSQIHQSELEFAGLNNQLNCVCCYEKSSPSYFIISIIPMN